MKKIVTIITLLIAVQCLHAQNPLVKKWDYRYGGMELDFITCFQETRDGGFVLGGYSASDMGGDKSQNAFGGFDYWVVKIDSAGIKEWDANFGALYNERLLALEQTADGGYILCGSSNSDDDGDKTEPNRDTINYSHDYWIVKIDSMGNKLWDKLYGGIDNDFLFSMQETSDHGFILGGSSYSRNSGDKSQDNRDTINFTNDYWIVKTDSMGVIEWEKTYGGPDDDQLTSVKQTKDGGYIIAGASVSDMGGDKTQSSKGNYDFWVIKTDAVGNILWDKDLGADALDIMYSLAITTDGGYILGGTSKSNQNGDKSQSNWDISGVTQDFWVVKIDSMGAKQWDKTYGGFKDEFQFGNITQTTDNGFLMSGISYSDISGNKTENNLGVEQSWVIKTDNGGTILWDKTLLTGAEDECGYALETKSGCYVMMNSCPAGIGGYKSQNFQGLEDYWIVKFCDSTVSPEGIYNISSSNLVSIYPNPFTDKVKIEILEANKSDLAIILYDALGHIVYSSHENRYNVPFSKTIDLKSLSKGVYSLIVIIDGERRIAKLVKE